MNKKTIFRSFALILIFAMLLCTGAAYADGGSAPSEAKNGVVRVYAEFDYGSDMFSIATGSAFGVGKNGSEPEYFVTNAHVCMDDYGNIADRLYILLDNDAVKIQVDENGDAVAVDLDEDKVIACEVVNEDLKQFPDVAVLKADEPVPGRKCLPLVKSSADIEDGTSVYALGFPGDVDVLTLHDDEYSVVADAGEVTLTAGIISKKTNSDLVGNTDVLVHSAAISSGNSGGPLIDEEGNVIGINTYSIAADSQYLSIYIDYAIEILEEHDIDYSSAGNADLIKTVILVAVIVLVAVVAFLLISKFKKGADQYVEDEREAANALRIQGLTGYFANRRFPIDTQVSLGRDPSNNIVFPTGTAGVSANHCLIIRNANQLYVKDLGSTYGTFINGSHKLPANQLVTIHVGDKLSLGSDAETFIITRKGGMV